MNVEFVGDPYDSLTNCLESGLVRHAQSGQSTSAVSKRRGDKWRFQQPCIVTNQTCPVRAAVGAQVPYLNGRGEQTAGGEKRHAE
jgi:hypothetical protein